MFEIVLLIVIFIMGILSAIFWAYKNLTENKEKDSKEKVIGRKVFAIFLMLVVFFACTYFIAFEIPIYISILQIIAIIIAKIFEKNKIIKYISILITFILVISIGTYCYYKYSHNNQFLKHTQYIEGIKSMGLETIDLRDLIQSAVDNNKKKYSKKVTIECILEEDSYSFYEKRNKKSYTKVEDLEWLLNNINIENTKVFFDYDNKMQVIEKINIVIPEEESKSENFWEYIVEFGKEETNVNYIKDFCTKAREELDKTIVTKPIKVVYVVNNTDRLEVNSLDELEVNQILDKLSEKETYRLLIQSYNDYYKISVMYYTR